MDVLNCIGSGDPENCRTNDNPFVTASPQQPALTECGGAFSDGSEALIATYADIEEN
jgi:hypothetical protein